MELTKVAVTRRSETGKGVAARLRAQGKIPATAYWKGEQAVGLAVAPKALVDVIGSAHGRNTVLELNVEDGESFPALLCDFQYHPVSRQLLHADFLRIALDAPVDVDVPFETTGKAAGTIKGGTMHVVFRKLPVRCLPQDIPVKVSVDVTPLELDGHIQVKDLALPAGVSIRLAPTQTLVAVVTESTGADEAATTTAEGAAAAPAAAGGAAAAAPAAAGAGDKAKPAAGAGASKAAGGAAKAPAAGGKAGGKGK
ncbi:MAG TPA: 50S ribosomal protein L25 [Polyangiaceae bacterium]|nr:50S ribosomal protein L25 [Polyangiaceae bacterium]